MTFSSTGANSKPVLDESGFQQLLAAAYVLQQHNDSLRAKDPRLDAAWIFSQITEAETLLRHGVLDFPQASSVIGERLCKMTGAMSVTVCLLENESVQCVSENGVAARSPGHSVSASSQAAIDRLKNGRQFQSLDTQADARLDTQLCSELGVRSLLVVPIQKSEQTTGLIEVRWGLSNALHECDVRTSRLMANLLSEMLERGDKPLSQHSPSWFSDQAPEQPEAPEYDPVVPVQKIETNESNAARAEHDLASHCRVCGRPFSGEEAFCGNCSLPRIAADAASDGLQSKWASMWFMQQAQDTIQERRTVPSKLSPPPYPSAPAPVKFTSHVADQWPPTRSANESEDENRVTSSVPHDRMFAEVYTDSSHTSELRILEDEPATESKSQHWSSALETLRPLLAVRVRISRKTAALAVCSIVVALLLATWLSWSARPASQLTWFKSLLVDLGLADVQPHQAPVYAGNPTVRVWEDVHTALYYCPDSDLYGKTPGGRFSTQRAAQDDQFESATRVACQ